MTAAQKNGLCPFGFEIPFETFYKRFGFIPDLGTSFSAKRAQVLSDLNLTEAEFSRDSR